MIVFDMPYFIDENGFAVVFENNSTQIVQPANRTSPTTLQSVTPAFPVAGPVDVVITFNGQPYSEGDFTFTYYGNQNNTNHLELGFLTCNVCHQIVLLLVQIVLHQTNLDVVGVLLFRAVLSVDNVQLPFRLRVHPLLQSLLHPIIQH